MRYAPLPNTLLSITANQTGRPVGHFQTMSKTSISRLK